MARQISLRVLCAALLAASVAAAQPAAPADNKDQQLSQAEAIANLEESLSQDRNRLRELQPELAAKEQQFEAVTKELKQLGKRQDALKAEQKRHADAGRSEEAQRVADALADLDQQLDRVKDRVVLALQARSVAQEQRATLAAKIRLNEQALARLKGEAVPAAPADNAAQPTAETDGAPKEAPSPEPPATTNDKVTRAQAAARRKEQAAQQAESDVQQAAERMIKLQDEIRLEQEGLATARKRADLLVESLNKLEEDFNRLVDAGTIPAELAPTRQKIQQASQSLEQVNAEVRRRTDRLQELRTQLIALQAEELRLADQAEAKRQEADTAHRAEWLISLREGLVSRGPRILVIAVVMLLVWRLSRVAVRRSVLMMTSEKASEQEREMRVATLSSFLRKGLTLVIGVVGGLMILEELDVPILPLWTMVSGVLAMVAIGFVAVWSVLSNTLCSMVLLVYQPFSVGNHVELPAANVRGRVVNFNLLFTTLEAEDGQFVEVPNNTFFQQPIVRRAGKTSRTLDEQLSQDENAD